ncbi:hypothetical protein [Moorena sp. SIOASIH]|nr:hypothetical protein [Moorena sp. SIOASIH]
MIIFVPCSLLPTPYSLFPDPLFPVPFAIANNWEHPILEKRKE